MKKVTIIIIFAVLAMGLGYFLFKISPQETPGSSYNSALDPSGAKKISAPPEFNPNYDHFLGNVNAKNVFIEYGDYQCPACAAYGEILKKVPTDFTDTVFVFRNYPLVNIHKNSVQAALAAEAAGAQGKYWEMHDIIFQKQADWQDMVDPLETFAEYAKQIGVANTDEFKSDVTSKKHLAKVQDDNNQAIGMDLSGTPTLFFNGHRLENQMLEGLKQQAQAFLNK